MADNDEQMTSDALEDWRNAEQIVAVMKRGRVAAEVAAATADYAAEAALTTADAAKAAVASAILAEASAAKAAKAAREFVRATRPDLVDAETDRALSEVDEVAAHDMYRDAVHRANERAYNRFAAERKARRAGWA
jgi:hypothetical protein